MGRDWVKLRRVYCAFASCLTERVGGGGGGTVSRVNSERVGGRGYCTDRGLSWRALCLDADDGAAKAVTAACGPGSDPDGEREHESEELFAGGAQGC